MGVVICIHTASICLFGQETLLFVFETFSSFGNIFVFAMLLVGIAFTCNNIFIYKTKIRANHSFVTHIKCVTLKINST